MSNWRGCRQPEAGWTNLHAGDDAESDALTEELIAAGPAPVIDLSQAVVAIMPQWVRYYDFGAGRMPRFLQDLTERNQS